MDALVKVGLVASLLLFSAAAVPAMDGEDGTKAYEFGFVGDVDVSCGNGLLQPTGSATGANVGGACWKAPDDSTGVTIVEVNDSRFGIIGGFAGYMDHRGDFHEFKAPPQEDEDASGMRKQTGGNFCGTNATYRWQDQTHPVKRLVVFVNGAVYQQSSCTEDPGVGTSGNITVAFDLAERTSFVPSVVDPVREKLPSIPEPQPQTSSSTTASSPGGATGGAGLP